MNKIDFKTRPNKNKKNMEALLGFIAMALSILAVIYQAEAGQMKITLIHTNNLYGEIVPCPT